VYALISSIDQRVTFDCYGKKSSGVLAFEFILDRTIIAVSENAVLSLITDARVVELSKEDMSISFNIHD